MMRRPLLFLALAILATGGCTTSSTRGTLAELEAEPAVVDEVYLEDSLERAAQSYRNYLDETPKSALTPEAMRRLADLQLEREYGIIGGTKTVSENGDGDSDAKQLDAHRTVSIAEVMDTNRDATGATTLFELEAEEDFERRATDMSDSLAESGEFDRLTFDGVEQTIPTGPLEAIRTYRQILETYPNYERNDQVLYQMSRAYDELGQPDDAMKVMARFVGDYPYSKYIDEVRFRGGEYFFVRRKYIDAEEEYSALVQLGPTSSYHELALYKLGWTLYKQELYEEALHRFISMLDFRQSIGYDFDTDFQATVEGEEGESDEHRVTDTFRVISLSFSNLGGPEVVSDYFDRYGHRSYADKIYSNLAEFYFAKLRYDDAASVYRAFVKLNPQHQASPYFGMRVIEIYEAGNFPMLVVEAKKQFARDYAIDARYWAHNDIDSSLEVIGFLKTNLTDLANHYHALFQDDTQVDERPDSFREARRWYRQFLVSFPTDPETPPIHYQLADLLLENEDYSEAAREYERTAYEYAFHDQAAAAGYAAVYAHREDLKTGTGSRYHAVRQATVESSLRFAETFPDHEQAAVVLGAAADDLYAMEDYGRAIESAQNLIDRFPNSSDDLHLSAWAVIAYSSMDIGEFRDSELAYLEMLALTPAEDESRQGVIDGLAAAIYKQGEQANETEDYRAAADHFLRIRDVAPTSNIRTSAEYDAGAALMKLEDWGMAAGVLEDFRSEFPEHELNKDATKQLAHIYREDGQLERSAAEHVRIADEAEDPEVSRAALLTAGDLYDEVANAAKTIEVYERYVVNYPRPIDIALETRTRLSEIFKAQSDYIRYHDELREIVAVDKAAGDDRTDRSRYLAARAALVLAELDFERFADLELRQPFEQSLAEKQRRMDAALDAFEGLVDYEVAEVTAAATYHIAEIYFNFSRSLVESERPDGLTAAELADYELVIEEDAYPFEEQAIEVHEANYELLISSEVYNDWVQRSLDRLALMMPGRYAKDEVSPGYVGSIDYYAYRMPIAPRPDVSDPDLDDTPVATQILPAGSSDPSALVQSSVVEP